MSTAQAALTSPEAASPPKKKGLIVSIRWKFVAFTSLLILAVMSAVGYSLFIQQRKSLTREVLGRGLTITENLTASCREMKLAGDELNLVLLVNKAVQQGGTTPTESRYDLRNPDHVKDGLMRAFVSLGDDLPRILSQIKAQVSEGAGGKVAAGTITPSRGIENEGIFEAIVVNEQGMVVAHHLGTSHMNVAYAAPKYVREVSPESPFPVYEQEVFDESGKRFVRRLFDISKEMEVQNDKGELKKLGVVHLGLSEDLISRVIFDVTMKLVMVTLLALLFGLLFTYVLVTWMTSPIGKLVKGVLAIAGGDFDTRIKVASGDELGELTQNFNEMASSLGQNAMLKSAFTRYVSDAALKQILADPSMKGLSTRRTMVAIFSSDVRGFTSMSETLEPEHVVQVINTYLSLQTEIILKHGGQVDKFIGDATIGVWGKEQSHEDDTIKAVRAAWEVQEAIVKLNAERLAKGDVAKDIGIGINTGEVVAGNMGSSKKIEYSCTGEARTFADALCDDCPPGKVWLGEESYHVVKDKVQAKKIVFNSTKGHGENLVAFEVLGFK
jgi:class 3 adenylate cyclase